MIGVELQRIQLRNRCASDATNCAGHRAVAAVGWTDTRTIVQMLGLMLQVDIGVRIHVDGTRGC